MLGFQGWNLAHDGDGSAFADHDLDVIAQVALYRIQSAPALIDCALQSLAPYVRGAYVTQVYEFLLVSYVVIQCGVGQPEDVGDVLQ